MVSFARTLSFALFIMLLLFLTMYVMPDPSKLGMIRPLVTSPGDCPKLQGAGVYDCFTSFAVSREDPGLCNRINNSYYRDKCYSKLTSGTSAEPLCKSIVSPEERGNCFSKVALATGNSDVCRDAVTGVGVTQDAGSDNCFYRYALGSEDINACVQVANSELAGGCLYFFASAARDRELCTVGPEGAEECCIVLLATDMLDPSLCEFLDAARDRCYMEVAVVARNPELCSEITDQAMSDSCKQEVG